MINSIFATVIGSESNDNDTTKGQGQSVNDNLATSETTKGKDDEVTGKQENKKNSESKQMTAIPEPINTGKEEWTKVVNKRKAAPIKQTTKQAKLQTSKGPNNKSPKAATTPNNRATSTSADGRTEVKEKTNSNGGSKTNKTGTNQNKNTAHLMQTKIEQHKGETGPGAQKKKENTKNNAHRAKINNNDNKHKNKAIENTEKLQSNKSINNNNKKVATNKGHIHQPVEKWTTRRFNDMLGCKPDGRPCNLETEETLDKWVQDYSTCGAGPYCLVIEPKKLMITNRCAGCGWCMHPQCSIPWKRTATHSKDGLYIHTAQIKAFCRFCVASKRIKLEKAGTGDAYVSTRYEAVRKHVRTDWATIRLGSPMETIDLNSNSSNEAPELEETSAKGGTGKHTIHNMLKLNESTSETPMEIDDDVATVTAANERMTKEPTFPPSQEAMTTKYIDVQLIIPAATSDDAMEPLTNLAEKLKKWMRGVQQICPSFKLHTVDPKHETQSTLHIIDELDWKKISDIKQYFRGAQPKPKGGRIFLRVKASFDMTMPEFLGNIEWYHQNQNERIQEASLQCFQSEILGYLLYSLRSTDAEAIKQALSTLIGKPISVRYMRINDGSKYEAARDTSRDPKALHIECDKEDAESIYTKIRTIYGTKQTKFPLGIKF